MRLPLSGLAFGVAAAGGLAAAQTLPGPAPDLPADAAPHDVASLDDIPQARP
jgi:hypothetical protein